MFQLYLHDMSEFMGWPIGADGRYGYDPALLSPYWDRGDHHPYFIMSEGEIAGFSLIRAFPNDPTLLDMGQFFTLRKFRRSGVGLEAFRHSVSAHQGKWQVRVLPENTAGLAFWDAAVRDASSDQYSHSRLSYHGIDMCAFRFDAQA